MLTKYIIAKGVKSENGIPLFPTTLTDFYNDYVNFLIKPHLTHNIKYPNIYERLNRLAEVAYDHFVYRETLSEKVLHKKLMPKNFDNIKNFFEYTLSSWTLGLLQQNLNKTESNVLLYEFVDRAVEWFLVAKHLVNILLKKNFKKYSKKKVKKFLSGLKASANRPRTELYGATVMWRIALGLLSREKISVEILSKLLEQLILICHTSKVAPSDITSLCIECVYELQYPTLVELVNQLQRNGMSLKILTIFNLLLNFYFCLHVAQTAYLIS